MGTSVPGTRVPVSFLRSTRANAPSHAAGSLYHALVVSALFSLLSWPVGAAAAQSALRASADSVDLTLSEVQRLALQRNPSFLALRENSAIARGALQQSKLLPFNPSVQMQLNGLISGNSDEPGTITLAQELEIAGQRGQRVAAAKRGVTRVDATVLNAARLTVADASVAFLRAVSAQRRETLARDLLVLNERLGVAVRTQLREGEISELDANLAEIEVGRARARVLAARREAAVASVALATQLGLPATMTFRLIDAEAEGVSAPQLSADSLLVVAASTRADLQAQRAAVQEAAALTSLARREWIPNLQLGVFAERRLEAVTGGPAYPRFGPSLGVSLPMFNRNQGVIAQRRALETQSLRELDAMRFALRADVSAALQSYQAASAELAIYTETVLGPARRNSGLLDTAFQAGKIALPTLLLLRNQLLDAELGYWDAWLAQHAARVQLDAATGALQPRTLPASTTSDTTRTRP
ncbi:MAG: TolC family protein [Gemmatimonadaceae bacterium]|nr:TolC family protein [Gemmatimonadaceae bacterium]